MRLLHPWPDLLGSRPYRRGQGKNPRRNSRTDERQYLPLRGLPQHRRSHPAGDGRNGDQVMINFEFSRATDVADAVRQIAADPDARFIAGGTNLIDLMKYDVERPMRLIDITRLPLKSVEETKDGGLLIGALVPNSDLAYHPLIEARYPLVSSAILAGASQQLRNMASTGSTPFSAPASPASRRTRPTCASRWRRLRPTCMSRGLPASALSGSRI